jgi:excisionase family DNA binding protein
MNPEAKGELISVKDAAQKCGRNAETVRRWIWSGKLPAEKLGNQLFIKRSALENYCRETAVLDDRSGVRQGGSCEATGKIREDITNGYDIDFRLHTSNTIKKTREQIHARIGRNFTEKETHNIMQHIPDEDIYGLSKVIQKDTVTLPPGSRSALIKKMRGLREQIRTRIGRDFTEDEILGEIYRMREERDSEISGLC